MGSRFLTRGSEGETNLTDGTADIYIHSAGLSGLQASSVVRTDGAKRLVSGPISVNDISDMPEIPDLNEVENDIAALEQKTQKMSYASGGDLTTFDSRLTVGTTNTTTGGNSVTIGSNNTASGSHSVVLGGVNNTASGDNSVVLGGGSTNLLNGNTASGRRSVVLGGLNNEVGERDSVVLGGRNNEVSAQDSAIIGGSNGAVTGIGSVIVGGGGGSTAVENRNTINHLQSVTLGGVGLNTSADQQVVMGRYNRGDANALFIIGNGPIRNNRSNAFRVLDDGKVVGDSFYENMSVASGSNKLISRGVLDGDLQVRDNRLTTLENNTRLLSTPDIRTQSIVSDDIQGVFLVLDAVDDNAERSTIVFRKNGGRKYKVSVEPDDVFAIGGSGRAGAGDYFLTIDEASDTTNIKTKTILEKQAYLTSETAGNEIVKKSYVDTAVQNVDLGGITTRVDDLESKTSQINYVGGYTFLNGTTDIEVGSVYVLTTTGGKGTLYSDRIWSRENPVDKNHVTRKEYVDNKISNDISNIDYTPITTRIDDLESNVPRLEAVENKTAGIFEYDEGINATLFNGNIANTTGFINTGQVNVLNAPTTDTHVITKEYFEPRAGKLISIAGVLKKDHSIEPDDPGMGIEVPGWTGVYVGIMKPVGEPSQMYVAVKGLSVGYSCYVNVTHSNSDGSSHAQGNFLQLINSSAGGTYALPDGEITTYNIMSRELCRFEVEMMAPLGGWITTIKGTAITLSGANFTQVNMVVTHRKRA